MRRDGSVGGAGPELWNDSPGTSRLCWPASFSSKGDWSTGPHVYECALEWEEDNINN